MKAMAANTTEQSPMGQIMVMRVLFPQPCYYDFEMEQSMELPI